MYSVLNQWMPVEPLRQSVIESCEGLFDQDYYDRTPAHLRRVGVLPEVLESYHVDKGHWKEMDKNLVLKCFEEFRSAIDAKRDHFLSQKIEDDYPVVTGLFWRAICRKEEMIEAEEARNWPMPDYLNDSEQRRWKGCVSAGNIPTLSRLSDPVNEAAFQRLYNLFRETVLNRVYKEMKESFDKGEDWVSNPLYEQKIMERRKELEHERNSTVEGRVVLTAFFIGLGFFFDSWRRM